MIFHNKYLTLLDDESYHMNNTVVGEIYAAMSATELKQLDQYIETSHWQYSETVLRCHQTFLHYTQKGELDQLEKSTLFATIYDEEKMNDSKLRFLINRLLQAIKEFILLEEQKADNIFCDKVWMDYLLAKKLRKNLSYHLHKEKKGENSAYKLLGEYFQGQEQSVYDFHYSRDVERQFGSLLEVMDRAERFSDLVFIKEYCSLISFTNVYQSLPVDLPKKKLEDIKQKGWEKKYNEFKVYISLINLLESRQPTDYYAFKEALFANFDEWGDAEKINFLTYLINYSTSQINKGSAEFLDEQYEFYLYQEKMEYFFIPGYLNHTHLNNVISIYLRKKDFSRAELFLSKYIHLIEKDYAENCQLYNQARIYFENQKHKECLRLMLRMDLMQDHFYSFHAKILLLKNYFELRETDAFLSLTVSFKEYIRRNKALSEAYKNGCLNLIKMIIKIYKTIPSQRKTLHKTIESMEQLSEKRWLLEKTAS